ncbi:MAG: glycosyltransferase family 4 protein [Hyphomicrobiales bacterium]|nr:glycosyltransferase family 4 protein [Hyphomicrobiales bacterium]
MTAAKSRILLSANQAWNLVNFRGGLIRALADAGMDIVAAAPPDGHEDRLAPLGCRFIPLPMNRKGANPVQDLSLLARYRSIMRAERPDVYLGWTIKPNTYGSLAARMSGAAAINNISGLGTAFIRDGWLTRIVKLLYRAGLSGSSTVFFQNGDDRKQFVDLGLVAQDRTALLPGSGVDLERFSIGATEPAARGEAFRFLLISRLLRDKGVGEYAEAASLLKSRGLDVTCSILGPLDHQNRTAFSQQDVDKWVQSGAIEYLGPADDVRPFVAACDCVVLPSYREGTPRTLLEAAAMSRPLIATDVPGCREALDAGETGLLCEVRNAVDLARAMQEMAEMDPAGRQAMGAAGRIKMEREFREQLVIDRYMEAIERALASRRRR